MIVKILVSMAGAITARAGQVMTLDDKTAAGLIELKRAEPIEPPAEEKETPAEPVATRRNGHRKIKQQIRDPGESDSA